MKHYILEEAALREIFNQAGDTYTIFRSPQKEEGVSWVNTPKLEKMVTSKVLTAPSIKEFLFPHSETLFKFSRHQQEVTLTPPFPSSHSLILGVHSCDLAGIKALDTLFKNTMVDELYQEKRQKTILVGLNCQARDWACFCSQLGINSQFSKDGDLFITSLPNGRYILSLTSNLGEAFLAKYWTNRSGEEVFVPADNKENIWLDFPKIKKVMENNFNSHLWEKLAQKCITCGICTFLCPTCHCFDLFDEERLGKGARSRCYDSCMFPGFTRMAGGYNPRAQKSARFRQRYLHKYKYFVDNFNLIACCGCGRCIRYCPVNVDVRENLNIFQNLSPG